MVGTVIDPEMNGEIKVTVVATGLGEVRKAPVKVIDNTVAAFLKYRNDASTAAKVKPT